MNKRILLIDGMYLAFRSFYGSQAASQFSSTPHFFFNSLISLIKNTNPDYLYIAIDLPGKTWRHKIYDEYKAGRVETPEGFREDLKKIYQLLEASNFKFGGAAEFEADDIIATLATKADSQDYVFVFSKDQDLLQLVSPNCSVLHDTNFNVVINHEDFMEVYGMVPDQVPDYKGLAGDSSDNLKGVAGIGKVTALKLLNKFQTLENIYENIFDEFISSSIRAKLVQDKESALFCKKMATLVRDVKLDFDFNDIKLNIVFDEPVQEMFTELKTVSRQLKKLYDSNNR
ncbi:DNA polymerase-1 [Mycoplasma testudineum]|uniref:5'-3' exonuclease n=1 Tax=Mycoplasma testudineum TaxID=244584 RepID=A0A4R6IE26_9MOLU|nr:5'-3' exonuclease [Mycoplasma testudineum]OYD26785.1 flap endonuclease [Mycoplasma testudineum]TDO19921.1 DNA polymerase-1 [Mycoplasma testudineum]